MLVNENQDLGPNKHQRSAKLERRQQRLNLNQKKFSALGPLSPYQMPMEVLTPMRCVMVRWLQNASPAKGLPQLQATCGTSLRHWRRMKRLVPDHHLIPPFTRLGQKALTWDVVCVCEYICTFSDGRFTNIHFTRWPKWQTWKNKYPQSDTIREHMALHHSKAWRKIIVLNKLKGWETIDLPTIGKNNQEPFSLEGFYQRLVRWVSVDDQVRKKSVNY